MILAEKNGDGPGKILEATLSFSFDRLGFFYLGNKNKRLYNCIEIVFWVEWAILGLLGLYNSDFYYPLIYFVITLFILLYFNLYIINKVIYSFNLIILRL